MIVSNLNLSQVIALDNVSDAEKTSESGQNQENTNEPQDETSTGQVDVSQNETSQETGEGTNQETSQEAGQEAGITEPQSPSEQAGNTEGENTETGSSETENTETSNTETGNTEAENTETGKTETGNGETENTETDNTEAGNTETENTETGNTEAGKNETENTETGKPETGNAETGNTETGNTETGNTETEKPETEKPEEEKSDEPMDAQSDTDPESEPEIDPEVDEEAETQQAYVPLIKYFEGDIGTTLLYPLPSKAYISCEFGSVEELHPTGHTGLDLAINQGTPVLAAEAGTIAKAEFNSISGNYVKIDHGNGLVTIYAHLSEINVQEGDTVKRGQQIGRVGATGYATGPHLHFEVRYNGEHVNPILYIEERCAAGSQSVTVDGVTITVDAGAGAFPIGWQLSAKKATVLEQVKIEYAISQIRESTSNIAKKHTFDIKILDADGNEVEPAAGIPVKVSFKDEELNGESLSANVYHVHESSLSGTPIGQVVPQELKAEVEGNTATVETDGFSYYTVEFTYGDLQYVLEGGGVIKLDDLLAEIGIEGTVKGVSVSNTELFNVVMGKEDSPRYMYIYSPAETGSDEVSDEETVDETEGTSGDEPAGSDNETAGEATEGTAEEGSDTTTDEETDEEIDEENIGKVYAPYIAVNDPEGTVRWVASYQPFTTEEWMDVLMEDGTTYHIIVTDAIMGDGTDVNIPGLYQGENLTNFAPLIPLADVWIDSQDKLWSDPTENYVNGNWDEFIPGELMDPNSSKYNPAFKEDYPVNGGNSKGSNKKGRHFVYYDSTVNALDGSIATTRKSDGVTVYQSYNYFEGTVGTYKWENAAVRMKDDGTEEYLDVYIEYSNPMITIQPLLDSQMGNNNTGWTNAANVTDPSQLVSLNNYYVGLFGGSVITPGAKTPTGGGLVQRYGLQIDAKPYIKDKSGNLVDVKMYFPMSDLDVSRSTNGKFAGFYQGNPLLANYDPTSDNYSESVRVKDGLVINSSGDRMYIPGADGNYKAVITYDDGAYTVGTEQGDNNTFYSGFLALVQNGQFKMTVRTSGGNAFGSLFTAAMLGGEYNYRLRHSTETLDRNGQPELDGTKGGTIQTTREGNHNGELNDGQIINPSMVASAVGQTIVYTFTPKPGYALKDVYIWNDPDKTDTTDFPAIADMDDTGRAGLTKIKEGNGSNNTYAAFDDDGDGVIDRYTYSFEGINSDNAIHVVWVQTALDIRKSVIGSGATDDTFTFTIKAWGDSDSDGTDEFVDFTDATTMGSLASRFTSLGNDLYQFTLDSYETISIPPGVIPFDFEYEVEEVEVSGKYGTLEGWTPVGSTVKSGNLTTDDPFGKVNFVNKRKKDMDPDGKLTIKKVWEEDVSNIRPQSINIYIQRDVAGVSSSTFKSGLESAFGGQSAMRNQLTAVKWGTKSQAEAASDKVTLANTYGDTPVYVWKEGTELYLYSDADIYLIAGLNDLFYSCTQLTDISALAHVHTDYVTSLYRAFYNCRSLTDLSPLAGWNTASVTTMSQTFLGTSRMALSDLSPLSGWDTRNVTNMQQIFAHTSVSDLSDIAGWDVTRVTTLNQAFAYTMAAQTAQTALADGWDPGECMYFGNMFQYANGGSDLTGNQYLNLPVFTVRPGTWSTTGGAYNNVAAGHQSQSDSDKPNETAFFNSAEAIIQTRAHDVDENDPSGNTWVYEFEVPADTKWKVWEVLSESYAPYYTISKTTLEDSEGATTDLGAGVGKEDNPAHGATAKSVTTLTNTRIKYRLKIEKNSTPATSNSFTFTLNLWSISESNKYDLPSTHPKILDGSLTRTAAGTYTFTLTPPNYIELELPAGIRYSVTEAPMDGWSLISESGTTGLLNRDKEALFVNAKDEPLRVVKTWENDADNNVWMSERPSNKDSLGIVVTAMDSYTRWKQTGPAVLTDIVGTAEQQTAFNAVRDLYEGSTIIPELKSYDGVTDIATYAPKRVHLSTAVGTLLPAGDYVIDAVEGNTGQYTVYPAENVPYKRTYTEPDDFQKDDDAGEWIYEFEIAHTDEVLGVEETIIPKYYNKVEYETTTETGQIVYNITNIMDTRDLVIEKKTEENEPGVFEYNVKFYYDTKTSERHPVKVGDIQIIKDKDAKGKDTYEYEIYFEDGVTYSGKNVSGLSEIVNEAASGKMTKTEMDAILGVMKNLKENAGTMVTGADGDFPSYYQTTLSLADLGIQLNGQSSSETIYIEQNASDLADLFENGRRLEWFIMPTPAQGETLSVHAPYELRTAAVTKNGITYPKQVPDGVTGANGTYRFTLKNGEKITFNDLPLGVSYEIVETKQIGWDLTSSVNAVGKMDQKNDNSGNVSEIWLYNGREYSTRAAAVTEAEGDVAESTVSGNKVYTNNAVYTNKDDAVAAAIIKNHDNTYAYSGTKYPTYDDAYNAVVSEVQSGKNSDNTYTYNGTTYYTRDAVENMALADIEEFDDNGVTKYKYVDNQGNTNISDTYMLIEQLALNDVDETGSDAAHAYTYKGNSYPSVAAAQYTVRSGIATTYDSETDTNTYSYGGQTYNSYEEAEAVALAQIVDNQDYTYTYKGKTYQTAAAAEQVGIATITANSDNTYRVNRQDYPTYAAAKAAAEALVETQGSGSSATYKLPATYDSIYDAKKAAKAAIMKKAYDDREATFTNEREKGEIKVIKETVSDDAGKFRFRVMTGRVVETDDVVNQNNSRITISRIYPQGQTGKRISVTGVNTGTDYTEYITENSDSYKFTEETVAGKKVNKVYKNNIEISTFNIVYPQEFTDSTGMNYKFTTTTITSGGTSVTTTNLDIETTVFEFWLDNSTDSDEKYAIIKNIPYGSHYRLLEATDANGNLVEAGWELIAIDGDKNKTTSEIDGNSYAGVDTILETDETVTHTFLNDRVKVPLTIKKTVTGNQGSRDKYFKFKIEIENAGERTLHLDMTNATKEFEAGADGTKAPNSATAYTRNVILNGSDTEGGNKRDDDANLTYGNATDDQKKTCGWTWVDDNGTPGDDSDDVTYRSEWDNDEGWITYAGDVKQEPGIEPVAAATRTFAHGQHINTDSNGKATIYVYLQHGQTATILDLPFGAQYTVTEYPEDYLSSTDITGPMEGVSGAQILVADVKTDEDWEENGTSVSVTEGEDIPLGSGQDAVRDTFIQKATEITFTNTRAGAVPTEIRLEKYAWLPVVLAAFLGLVIILRRKRLRDDE